MSQVTRTRSPRTVPEEPQRIRGVVRLSARELRFQRRVTLAFTVTGMTKMRRHSGAQFAAFLFCYCVIRFGLEWLKPPFGDAAQDSLPVALYAKLTAIQWAALLGMAWYFCLLRIRLSTPSPR